MVQWTRRWDNERKAQWARNQEKRFANRFKPFHKQTRMQYEKSYLQDKRYKFRKASTKILTFTKRRYAQAQQRANQNRQMSFARNRKQRGTWKRILNSRLHTYQTPRQNYIYNEVMDISRIEAEKMNEVRDISDLAKKGLI